MKISVLKIYAVRNINQYLSNPTREGALLDLLFVNREGLVDNVAVGGRLGHSDHEIIVLYSYRGQERGQQNCHPGLPKS